MKVGDTIFVQSRIDGSTLAKRILKVPDDTPGSGVDWNEDAVRDSRGSGVVR